MTVNAKKMLIVPDAMKVLYDTFHFAPATRVGDTVWVSGQVGLKPDMTVGNGMQEQATIAFESLKLVLEAAGASLADVVELNTFHTNFQKELPEFTAVKDTYFTDSFPAWTAVGITELALPGLCIEVRATAVVGSGA